MNNQDDFFTPEDVDRQIDQVSSLKEGERADAEAMAYLRSFYGTDAQQEQRALDRIWNRIASAAPPITAQLQPDFQPEQERKGTINRQNQPTLLSNRAIDKKSPTLWQRLGMLAAVVVVVALVGSMAILFYAIRHNSGVPASHKPTPTTITTPTPSTPTTTVAPFKVTTVDMSVTPASIAGLACGTNLTVTYKATIHVAANSPGGTVLFSYTTDNGRGQTPASLTFSPGQTVGTYTFTSSGALSADHTYPGLGGIQVISPNQLTSSTIQPSGACVSQQAAFAVTSVDMAVSPTSIQGMACGTNLTVTYTATIHVAANSPGGTVRFTYTTDNGRGSTPASLTFSPGQTVGTYSFTWSGALPADHTAPGLGGIQVTSPNQLTSSMIKPSGTCT